MDMVLKSSEIDNHLGEVQTDRVRAIHHWIAGVIIILFSLYYFALQSQSYDIGAFKHYSFFLEPELFEFYRTSPEVLAVHHTNHSAILGLFKGYVIAYNRNVNDIVFGHIITFNLLLRSLNFITGHTIVSIKILVLPKLLIFLFGMYALLYYLTKRVYPSLLVSLLAIIPRFLPDDHWAIGPLFAGEARHFAYIFLPLAVFLFLKYRTDLRAMCLLYFGIGCLGNIHPAAALSIVLMLSFTQLWFKGDRLKLAAIPLFCALFGVFPYLIAHIYKQFIVQHTMFHGDFRSIRLTIKMISGVSDGAISMPTLLQQAVEAVIYPIYNLYTLAIPLLIGIYYFVKNYNNTSVKKILAIQTCYTLFFFIPVVIYRVFNISGGGWIVYIGRSSSFVYLFIFIFVTFAVIWAMDLVDRWVNHRLSLPGKRRVCVSYLAKVLVGCLIILIVYPPVYPPIGLKPNKYFPSYDFRGQINAIGSFVSGGFTIGAVDKHFTDMANYIGKANQLPPGSTFAARDFDALIFLARQPVYELPPGAAAIDVQLARYDHYENVIERSQDTVFYGLAELILPSFCYDSQCRLFVNMVSGYMKSNGIDYVIVSSRYLPYLSDKLAPVWFNDKYVICENSHIESG